MSIGDPNRSSGGSHMRNYLSLRRPTPQANLPRTVLERTWSVDTGLGCDRAIPFAQRRGTTTPDQCNRGSPHGYAAMSLTPGKTD